MERDKISSKASDFSAEILCNELIKKISDKNEFPFPHIKVIGPDPFSIKKSSNIFTQFTSLPPNVIGSKVKILPQNELSNEEIISSSYISFFIKISDLNKFDFYEFFIEFNFISKKFKFKYNKNGELKELTEEEVSEHYVYKKEIVIPYTFSYMNKQGDIDKINFELTLEFYKEIEMSSNEWKSEFKVKNKSLKEKSISLYRESKNYEISDIKKEIDEMGEYYADSTNHFVPNYLLDFSYTEDIKNSRFCIKSNPVLRIFNVVPIDIKEDKISFSDHYIGKEIIPQMKKSDNNIYNFIKKLKYPLSKSFVEAFKKVFNTESPVLYKYQEEAIESILDEIHNRRGIVNVISVRTAGGKTETFLVPIIQYCLDNLSKKGVKVLIFYPTKALANDQAKRLLEVLYYINKENIKENKRKITMGLYHGDVNFKMKDDIEWFPFKSITYPDINLEHRFDEKKKRNILFCPKSDEEYDFIYLTRSEIHRDLPDILITNPDTLTYVLTSYPERHSILGRTIAICPKCGLSTDNIKKRKCINSDCNGDLEVIKPEIIPQIFVFDEIHLFYGTFGMNVSKFIERLISVLKFYSNNNFKPIFIASSATIKDPKNFISKIFKVSNDKIKMLPENESDYYDYSQTHIRHHLFILPRAYRAKQTTSMLMKYIFDKFKALYPDIKPRILTFVNSINDCNDLIIETKKRNQTEFIIDGHNTQYNKSQRIQIEKKFNIGEINLLYATSTLEVGIDFDDINILCLYGPPFYFNDYLQRIGRSGRRGEALVITVCKGNNAIDYYYFENSYKLIYNPSKFINKIPIGDRNPKINEKSLILAFFDFLQIQEDNYKFNDANYFINYFFYNNEWIQEKKTEIINYWKNVFKEIDDYAIENVLKKLKKSAYILREKSIRNFKMEFHNYYNVIEGLNNLRSSELSVEVEYIFGG